MESRQTHLTSVMSEASIRAKTADLGLSAMETQPSQRHWSTRPKHSYVSMKLASTLLLSILLSEQCHHFVNPRLPEKSFYFAHRNMLPAPNTAWKTRCYCAHEAWRLAQRNDPSFSHTRATTPCPNATPPPGAINLQAQILRLHQFSQGQNPSSFHARWLPDRMLARIPQYLPWQILKHQNTSPHESLPDLNSQIIAPAPKINLPPFTPLRHSKIRTQVITSRSGSGLRSHGLQFEVLVHGTGTIEAQPAWGFPVLLAQHCHWSFENDHIITETFTSIHPWRPQTLASVVRLKWPLCCFSDAALSG